MRIIICENYNGMSKKAAQIVASQITLKPNSILGLSTGSTPVGMYQELVEMYKNNIIDFAHIKTFNLDEYCGLEQSDSQSYYSFMKENLFGKVNLSPDQIYLPNGISKNFETECTQYDKLIEEAGGIDLQVLGIGKNAHIGFNEPNDYFEIETHVSKLDESTRQANARFFGNVEEVPTQAITMGIGSILKSKKIMLLVSGKSKAKAVYDTLYGKVTPKVPSSILRLHSDVILILDEEAASLLDN